MTEGYLPIYVLKNVMRIITSCLSFIGYIIRVCTVCFMKLKMKFKIEVRLKRDQLEKHMLITGGTGSGKSQLLLNIALSLAKSKKCCVILQEPHSDIAKKLVAARDIAEERIVFISTTMQRDSNYPERICA